MESNKLVLNPTGVNEANLLLKKQRSLKARVFLYCLVETLLIIAVVFLLPLEIHWKISIAVPIFFIAIALTVGLNRSDENKYSQIVRQKIIRPAYQAYFDDVKVMSGGYLRRDIELAGIIKIGDSVRSNNMVEVVKNKRKISHANVKSVKLTRDKKNNTTNDTTLFDGRWYVLELETEFSGIIQINKIGLIDNLTPSFGKNKFDLVDVELDNDKFNDSYSLKATSKHDAFYMLTPHFVERLMTVVTYFEAKVSFAIIKNKLYISVSYLPALTNTIDEKLDDKFAKKLNKDINHLVDVLALFE